MQRGVRVRDRIIRAEGAADLDRARAVMLDPVHRDFGAGTSSRR